MKIRPFKSTRQPFASISAENPRSDLGDRAFIAALTTSVGSDAGSGSLESLRRSVQGLTNQSISKASFHQRLGTQRLNRLLVSALDQQSVGQASSKSADNLLAELGVTAILLQDASTFGLPNEARHLFPGVNTDKGSAALKIHATFDLLSMAMIYHALSRGIDNDSLYFPEISELKGKLIIADLGYYDFSRFEAIHEAGGFFLSRIKTNCRAIVTEIPTSESAVNVGRTIHETSWLGTTIDLKAKFDQGPHSKVFRVVGFWNRKDRKYHWYVTNLKACAALIYPLYRARWQIELAFKALKQSLTPDRISSSVPMIIRNLVLIYMLRLGLTSNINLCMDLDTDDTNTKSIQVAAKILNHVYSEFFEFLTRGTRVALSRLHEKLQLYRKEFVAPKNPKKYATFQIISAVLNQT